MTYRKMKRGIETGVIDSITLDIFDTVLLRDTWPEGLQFLEVAERWLPLLRKQISPDLSAYEIYSWREYSRRELLRAKERVARRTEASSVLAGDLPPDRADVDVNLADWLSELVRSLQVKHGRRVSISDALIAKLIDIELDCEVEHLNPNLKLAADIRRLRVEHPRLRVYFLSDMYLNSEQVNRLLVAHGVADLFDDGITSTEVQRAKHSGQVFQHAHAGLTRLQPFDIYRNIHVGDSVHSDVRMAVIAGSSAVHLYRPRLRRLRTRLGERRLKRIQVQHRKLARQRFGQSLRNAGSTSDLLRNYGRLFAQPLAVYLLHLERMARLAPANYLLVSSEAEVFQRAATHLLGRPISGVETAPKLNRKLIIRACVWALARERQPEYVWPLVHIVLYGEFGDNYRSEVLRFIFGSTHPASQLVVNHQSDDDFASLLYKTLRGARPSETAPLRDAYKVVAALLPKEGDSTIICDVGWGGTVQVLLSQFAQLHGVHSPVEGLYVGVHPPKRFGISPPPMTGYLLPNVLERPWSQYWSPVLWEYVYTNKPQFFEDAQRLEHVRNGLDAGLRDVLGSELSPTEHWNAVAAPRIRRLLQHPSREEVLALGPIRFDFGFINKTAVQLVDCSIHPLKLYSQLLRQPKQTLKGFFGLSWAAGYLSYYRLGLLRYVINAYGRLRGKVYF